MVSMDSAMVGDRWPDRQPARGEGVRAIVTGLARGAGQGRPPRPIDGSGKGLGRLTGRIGRPGMASAAAALLRAELYRPRRDHATIALGSEGGAPGEVGLLRLWWPAGRDPEHPQTLFQRVPATRLPQRSPLRGVELRTCRVEQITKAEAARIILPREPLGTLGNCEVFFGLRTPAGRLIGALGLGRGPHGCGADIVLERGACLPGAPRNAASFLIGRAIRLGPKVHGWTSVRAYSDPRFGETGLIYRVAGFKACPPSKHGKRFRYALVAGGRVLSDRAIIRRFGSYGAARAAAAAIVRLPARVAWEWRSPDQRRP